jgi:hypothetical protein
MSFDMNQCRVGDKLASCHGLVLIYQGKCGIKDYPHKVQYPDGSVGTRTNDGQVILSSRLKLDTDHDIVGFYEEK